MNDDLFGDKNRNEFGSNQEPLENANGSVCHICSGCVISQEAHKTLMEISARCFNPEFILKVLESSIKHLKAINIDTDDLKYAVKCVAESFEKCNETTPSPDNLQKVFDSFADDVASYLSDLNDQLRDQLAAGNNTDCNDSNFTEGTFNILEPRNIIKHLSIALDFLVPQEELIHRTNVGAVLNTIYKDPTLSQKKNDDINLNSVEELSPAPVKQLNYYTTLSPHLVRVILIYANEIYGSFLNKLPKAPISKEDFLSELKDYDNSQLASVLKDPISNIQSNEQGITITWEIPPCLKEEACKRKDILIEVAQPFCKLLDEINESTNSLSFEIVDGDKITVNIKLPHQDPPELSKKERYEEDCIYSMFKSAITFDPSPSQANFLISNGEDSQLNLIISNNIANNEFGRMDLISTISHLDKINTKRPLTQLKLSDKLPRLSFSFGEENNKTNIQVLNSLLLINRYQAGLSKIVDDDTCHTFTHTYRRGNLSTESFDNIRRILRKAKEICNEKVQACLKESDEIIPTPILEITDSNGTLIGRLFSENFKDFGGRLCSKKLTKKVLTIFDSILDDAAEEDPIADLTDFLSNDFLVRLERYGIQPSKDYISFQRFLADPDNLKGASLIDSWLSIRDQIIRGNVFFEKKDGKIFIDAPKAPKEIIPFLKRHII